jgi:hypothetical protein
MALTTTMSNTLIDGNVFTDGYSSANGTTVVHSQYSYLLLNSTDAKITNNTFSGQASNVLNDMVELQNCSTMISNNKFLRFNSTVKSFINNTSSTADQIIKDNLFDNLTCDSSTDYEIVKGLNTTSIYNSNKNQSSYALFMMEDQGISGVSSEPWYWTTTNNFSTQITQYFGTSEINSVYVLNGVILTAGNNAGLNRNLNLYVNLSKSLPKNVKILESLIGFRFNQIGANLKIDEASTISTNLYKTLASRLINNPFSTPANTLARIHSGVINNLESPSTSSVVISGPDYETTTTKYIAADYSALNYITGETQDIIINFNYDFKTEASSAASVYLLSPLLIKYQWV